MQVLANDPRFSGKSEADIQQMVFGPPQGLSSLQEQQRLLAGGVATGGQMGQFLPKQINRLNNAGNSMVPRFASPEQIELVSDLASELQKLHPHLNIAASKFGHINVMQDQGILQS